MSKQIETKRIKAVWWEIFKHADVRLDLRNCIKLVKGPCVKHSSAENIPSARCPARPNCSFVN